MSRRSKPDEYRAKRNPERTPDPPEPEPVGGERNVDRMRDAGG
ncbi:MAG: hypothetical protein ACRELC_12700 [Gemmatimonadota bacterium]